MTNKQDKEQDNVKAASPKRKILNGVVTSIKMDKTIVVRVVSKKMHPLYKKILSSSKKYLAHSDKKVNVGDAIELEQCKPLSKCKKWRVLSKQ
ncbi:MAG: 30S ribosomal protein S17 [Patescibacteria group bacterium]|nr:30S ribosomal protein S17 [Patescibacteria group bacterium]